MVIGHLGVPREEIVFANPFFQRTTRTQPGCQLDLAIQSRFNTVYVCEIKFSKSPIRGAVIDEVERKIATLKLPRQFSVRPVLIHVNGAHEEVIERGYFAAIIDFGELLTG
ncbi:MAG: hypothetical protein ACYCUE_16275 [Steroidobacteraceae bacterium]